MDHNDLSPSDTATARTAWNNGKIIGPRPPLRPGHVWSIRAKLDLERRLGDLALFNLAIDILLTDAGSVKRITIGRDITDAQRNKITASQLAVRNKIILSGCAGHKPHRRSHVQLRCEGRGHHECEPHSHNASHPAETVEGLAQNRAAHEPAREV